MNYRYHLFRADSSNLLDILNILGSSGWIFNTLFIRRKGFIIKREVMEILMSRDESNLEENTTTYPIYKHGNEYFRLLIDHKMDTAGAIVVLQHTASKVFKTEVLEDFSKLYTLVEDPYVNNMRII